MSIGPVQHLGPVRELTTGRAQPRDLAPQAHPDQVEPPNLPGSGGVPNREAQVPKDLSTASQLPEDVVELQYDGGPQKKLVVRYLDKAGEVILQVPSQQLLNVERSFAEEFLQTQANHRKAPTRSES